MSQISSMPDMKTRVLTVMATRDQDQDLVSSVAETYGVKSPNPSAWSKDECIVPCFGWHPWFGHQMYISPALEEKGISVIMQDAAADEKEENLQGEDKIKHYQNVLLPTSSEPSEEYRQIYMSFPDPMPFSKFLRECRSHLEKHPYALVGEIGLDKAFRIPLAWASDSESKRDDSLTPGGREGRRLSPFRTNPKHLTAIFKLQLQLAGAMRRAVSVHGVQCAGLVYQAIADTWRGHENRTLSKRQKKKRGQDHPSVDAEGQEEEEEEEEEKKKAGSDKPLPYPPRICLHSYSGRADSFNEYLNPKNPAEIYASFSTAINLGDDIDGPIPDNFEKVIKFVPDNMLLVESDLHTAGGEMDRRMEDIVRKICRIKGWGLEEGVQTLGRNWRRFVFGTVEEG
ncbi:Metallo-dependent hydrolase [Corynespora cassiicola Philippines]|uniref:Metallo-dependent hydrolase n=1 Tax=Corynespora cassiicola Philippines TaxID=1448308 RepID=A0A2T2NYY7_CORCC|nr:Metallo-dependent hydrolase [Corynespora cassiicola Philippines]